MSGKIILYGAGRFGQLALTRYGKSEVAYFCDSHSRESNIDGIPIIRPDRMIELCKSDDSYRVIITPGNFDIRDEMAIPLKENNIAYTAFERNDHLTGGKRIINITSDGNGLSLKYEPDEVKGFERRIPLTYGLFEKTYEMYRSEFEGKLIDITVFIGDHCLDAYRNRINSSTGYVCAYNSVAALDEHVVMIPDYRTCYDADDYAFDETPEKCATASDKDWSDNRILWKGNITSDDSRSFLEILANRYPSVLSVDDPVNNKSLQFVPMTDFADNKYLLDIRGYGWSDRLKILLQLGRPVFIVDRPYKEWYTDKLVPWTHYVPVKEDMSDLIEHFTYMEEHPDKYDEIVNNMRAFVNQYLMPEAVLRYTKDLMMRYGVID